MIVLDRQLGVISCTECYDHEELRRALLSNPEALTEFTELYTIDHIDCAKFKDARKARMHRQFRKEAERRLLVGQTRHHHAH